MKQDILEPYNKLTKKCSLPDFDKLEQEFEISTIDTDEFLLKHITKKITETLEDHQKTLNNILSPDTSSLIDMHECRVFNDNEKKELYALFRKLMIITRKADILTINYNEKQTASFISRSLVEWSQLKKEMEDILKKLAKSWENETKVKVEVGYLG